MTPQWRRRLASEGLILVIGLFVGFLAIPLLVFCLLVGFSHAPCLTVHDTYLEFLAITFLSKVPAWKTDVIVRWVPASSSQRLLTWALVLGPYAVYQLVRSIIWVVKALRAT